jgi:hypothetical protein
MKITIFIIKFLFIGALFLVTNEHLYLSDPQDRATFFDLFYSWLASLTSRVVQVTGYVTSSSWLPQNYSVPAS